MIDVGSEARPIITLDGVGYHYQIIYRHGITDVVPINGGEICAPINSNIRLEYVTNSPYLSSYNYLWEKAGTRVIDSSDEIKDWEFPLELVTLVNIKDRVSEIIASTITATTVTLNQMLFDISGYGDQSNWNKSDFTLQYTSDGETMYDIEFILSINSEKTLVALNPSPIEGLTPATPYIIIFRWKDNELGTLEVVTEPDLKKRGGVSN